MDPFNNNQIGLLFYIVFNILFDIVFSDVRVENTENNCSKHTSSWNAFAFNDLTGLSVTWKHVGSVDIRYRGNRIGMIASSTLYQVWYH